MPGISAAFFKGLRSPEAAPLVASLPANVSSRAKLPDFSSSERVNCKAIHSQTNSTAFFERETTEKVIYPKTI